MSRDEIKKQILEYIITHKGTSYAELESLLDRLQFEYRGQLEARAGANPNVILWAGWNLEALQMLSELLAAGLIERTPCSPIIYGIDGTMLDYPVLAGDPSRATSPHWLPILFNAC